MTLTLADEDRSSSGLSPHQSKQVNLVVRVQFHNRFFPVGGGLFARPHRLGLPATLIVRTPAMTFTLHISQSRPGLDSCPPFCPPQAFLRNGQKSGFSEINGALITSVSCNVNGIVVTLECSRLVSGSFVNPYFGCFFRVHQFHLGCLGGLSRRLDHGLEKILQAAVFMDNHFTACSTSYAFTSAAGLMIAFDILPAMAVQHAAVEALRGDQHRAIRIAALSTLTTILVLFSERTKPSRSFCCRR